MHPDTPPPDDDTPQLEDMEEIIFLDESEIESYHEEVIEVIDEAKTTFNGHSKPVFCCAFDKSGRYAVSGGEDDKAFVWDVCSGTTKFECEGHGDSVIVASFNYDSTLLVSGDMSGLIKLWDCSAETNASCCEFDLGEDLKFLIWHSQTNHLFAGSSSGMCYLWEVSKGGEILPQINPILPVYGINSECASFLPDGYKAVVAYDDGSIRLWDLPNSLLHTIHGHEAHSDVITALDCHPTKNLIISGCIDGTAKLIKSTDGKVLHTVHCASENDDNLSVEGLGFFSSEQYFATGTVAGSLAIWDIPTKVRRLQCEQESGISHLRCDSSRPMVYTSGLDGIVRLYDARTGQEASRWTGHSAAILDFNISSCGRFILTSSDDCTCKIFDTR